MFSREIKVVNLANFFWKPLSFHEFWRLRTISCQHKGKSEPLRFREFFDKKTEITNISSNTSEFRSFPLLQNGAILFLMQVQNSRNLLVLILPPKSNHVVQWAGSQNNFEKEEKSGKFYRCHIETIRDEIRQHLQFRKERPRVLCMQLRFTVKTSRVVG